MPVHTPSENRAFMSTLWDEFRSYLFLGLEIRTEVPGYAVVVAKVENSGRRTKNLGAAFLLLGPFTEDPVQTYNTIAVRTGLTEARYTDDILRSNASRTLVADGGIRQLIPLPFFTEENVRVGDEKLACSIPIKLEAAHYTGPYSVRLFVGGDARWMPRMHRSVHDVILVDPASSPW
ncbi:hypothetical protein Airi02_029540 [Actinoallomurus iriomotensis]|uniref:Uncharacterized protein n=2 Tax=Actinoallomurus iriomotensis TaxID=478107 RepID=A0A9W6VYM6_9ACTN|nr:hypothetical protein Airi02_029540 [Actinoallomurus iriomotensis]